jgi:peptide/nickel transport system substrate-binding protein
VTAQRKIALFICFCTLFFCFSAGNSTRSFAQTEGGHLVYGTWQTPDTLDVQASSREVVFAIAWSYLDPLVRTRPDDPKYYPGLAQRWGVSSDAKEYTFTLRKDVQFHDGTPLTADAVKFSLDRLMDPRTKAKAARDALGPFERCEVVDKYTVKIYFKKPYGSFLSMASTVYVPIISPGAVNRYGTAYHQHVAGTGPFILEEYIPEKHATFVRNERYQWGPEWTHRGPAHLDKITYRFIPDEITRIGTLRTRETNLIDGIKTNHIYSVVRDRRLEIEINGMRGAPYSLLLNCQKFPTDDRIVRQAISYAIDREALVQLLYKGTTKPAYSPIERGTLGYSPAVDTLTTYDPKRAQGILERAGWKEGPNGIRVKDGRKLAVEAMLCEREREPSEVIKGQLKKVGAELIVGVHDSDSAFPIWEAGDCNMVLTSFYWPDPNLITKWFSWESIGTINRVHYSNPKLEDLLAEAEMTTNPEKRAAVYKRVQEFLVIDAVCIPLFGKSVVLGMRREIEGIVYSKTGYPIFYEAYFSWQE